MRFLLFVISFHCALPSLAQSIETVIQRGHELAVIAISASPNNNYVVTGSRDKSAKLWELSTGREVRSFLGHDYSVTTVDVSSDGNYLLTGSNDETVKLWAMETGKELFSINPVHEQIKHVAISPDMKFFVTAALRHNVQVYDFKSKKKIKEIEVNPESNRNGVDVAISPDSKWIAFGEDNRVVTVYRTSDWQKVYTFEYGSGWCGGCSTFCQFSPDSKSLVMASHNGSAKKYDLTGGKLLVQFADSLRDPSSIAVSPNNKMVALALKKEIIVWNSETGNELKRFNPGVEQEINETIFSHDGKQLFITCDNNTTIIWDIKNSKAIKSLTGFLNFRDKGGITYDPNFIWDAQIAKYVRFKNNLIITADGQTLIKGKFGSKVKQWNIATGKNIMEFVGHSKAVLCYDLTKDGKRLVTGGGDGKIIFWNTRTGDTIRTIKAHNEPILDIHFNSDETKVAASSWDGRMITWDVTNGKSINYFDFENNSALNLLWGPNDLYLIGGLGKDLKMWELDTRSVVRDFTGHSDVISSLRLSADKRQLLSASWDGSIRLWNVGTGLMEQKFVGHRGAVHVAIFNSDNKTIFSAGADRQIRVWDIATAKVIRTFDGHKAEVTSLLFSPDHKMLISHSVDGTTKFWDLNSGKEFFEHIHFGEKEWMVKNPNGYFNGTQDARKYIHFVSGMKTYSANQFFDEFYRPDLLPKIFQSRGNDGSQGINNKLKNAPPPTVKIAVLPTTDPAKAELFLKIIDNGAGAENLKVFHNGKRIGIGNFKLSQDSAKSSSVRETVSLIGGMNTFSASAANTDKIESDPVSAEIFSELSDKTSVCHIIAVGINQYKNPKMTLNYAKPDAESFGKAVNSIGLFKDIELHTLYDTEASRFNILKLLEDCASRIHQEDVFIFYYAGHGSMVDNQFFFIPSESARLYDLSSLKKEAIDAAILQEKFKNIKALKQLIIMDACQSGGSVELLATRGAAEEKAIAQLSRSAGIHVMASAGSEQFAAEFAELGHGIFTYLLIKGLQGEADGAPKDGKVTIYELKSFLDDQVPELTRKLKGKPQYPYTFSRGQDFPVVLDLH
ncbi:MAG: caspase family protein [Bacteroidetes bacterium]|nr:caspase family protein [Bacteroidota bacterium]